MDFTRRQTVRSLAGLFGSATVAGCAERSTTDGGTESKSPPATTTAAASPASGTLDAFLDRVPNYEGQLRDRRGESTVRVRVGVELGYGPFGFGPPALHVDPGTTIRWVWTGEGGQHNVVAKDGTFDSGRAIDDAGVTFEYTLDSPGTYRYYCEPHRTSEMKGAILVGPDPTSPTATQSNTSE